MAPALLLIAAAACAIALMAMRSERLPDGHALPCGSADERPAVLRPDTRAVASVLVKRGGDAGTLHILIAVFC
jgi:hypothetical protein